MRRKIKRKPIKFVGLIDPFGQAGGQSVCDERENTQTQASLPDDMASMHKALLATQNELIQVWAQAEDSITPSSASHDHGLIPGQSGAEIGSEGPDSGQTQSDLELMVKRLASREKALTKQKVETISARAKSMHSALTEIHGKLMELWAQTDSRFSGVLSQQPDSQNSTASDPNKTG